MFRTICPHDVPSNMQELLEKMAHIRPYAISSIRFGDRLYTLEMSEASGRMMVSGNRVVSLPCRLPQDYATCPGWDVSSH